MARKKKIKEKHRFLKGVLKLLLTLIILVVLAAGALVGYLTLGEYKPAAEAYIAPTEGASAENVPKGETLRILTWNTGYGALGENADFFMDGGKGVRTEDGEGVRGNLAAMLGRAGELSPDFMILQEVDRDSDRSCHVDETLQWKSAFSGTDTAFAGNYRVAFIPYPWPPLGKVDSGIMTLAGFRIRDAVRVSLPCPFDWPLRIVNLKRCLLVSRYAVEGSDKELVVVNLHLEAYDDGEGKIAQTAQLRELLETEKAKGNYVIAGGDFNQTFSTVDASLYPPQEGKWHCGAIDTTDFPEGWQFLMDSSVPTCRSLDRPYAGADRQTFQYYMIDGFIVSDNVTVESYETLDEGFAVTDHNPVLLSFRLE